MSEAISISTRLDELLVAVIDWTIAKIEEGSGFTVLVMVDTPGSKNAHNYNLNDAEEAFARAKADILKPEEAVQAYAMAHDASLFSKDGTEHRCVICRVEELGMGEAHELVQFFQFQHPEIGFGSPVERDGGIRYYRTVERWFASES
jgi:hypothetical protein